VIMGMREFVLRQNNFLACCYVYSVPYQSVRQFTGAGCVGRVNNPGAWGVGKSMQLGFQRGKKLCVREFACMCGGVCAGKRTIFCPCGGVMWKTMMPSCRLLLRWPDNR